MYFHLFFQPYLLKYLLTLFQFHIATAIYTPIHAKAGEVDGGMRLGVAVGCRGLRWAITDQIYKSPSGDHPYIQPFEGFKVQFHLESV